VSVRQQEKARRVHLGVLVDQEQRQQLERVARDSDRSVSSVARQAFDAYLADRTSGREREATR
jgi:predicted transcriptional regulator